jgi:hypothetical protein
MYGPQNGSNSATSWEQSYVLSLLSHLSAAHVNAPYTWHLFQV